MTRHFDYINLTLLALLGGLCVVQWSHEKDYASQVVALRQTASTQSDKISLQTETIQRASEDIEEFKHEIVSFKEQADQSNALIREQKAQIFVFEEEKGRTARQNAEWQKALEEYKKAITGRDDNIKTLLAQREQLVAANKDGAAKANEAVIAFNELATKYEDVVRRYNALVTHAQSGQEAPSAVPK